MRTHAIFVSIASLCLAACGQSASGTDDSDTSGADQASVDDITLTGDSTATTEDVGDLFVGAPPAICRSGTVWKDQASFTDITSLAFSVDVTQVVGTSISSSDINGDYLPDLSVRSSSGQGKREDWTPGKRAIWLLKNVTAKAGIQFSDTTKASGLTVTRDGADGREMQIVVFGDVDNDGDVDMFCGDSMLTDQTKDNFKQDSSELMLNDGTGHFALPPTASFATKDLRRSLGAASFTDYDRDGKLDLWLGYMTWGAGGVPIPDQLVQGSGTGDFLAVSTAEGLVTKNYTQANVEDGSAPHHTWCTAACDVDNDGEPDLLTASYGRDFNTFWHGGFKGGDGSTRFVQHMHESHLDRDDNDDWTTNWNAQCYCHDNPTADECDKCGPPEVDCVQLKAAFGGIYRWNHPTDRKPYRLGGNTGLLTCADIDNDGDLDLVEGTIVHPDVGPSSDPTRIIRNDGGKDIPLFAHLHGDVSGIQRTWPNGQADDVGDMAGAVFDFDNDGRLDVLIASSDYPGTHALLFHQKADGTFEEVPIAKGIDFKHSHGATVADFDRDGDLDVVLGHSTMRCSLSPKECFKTEEVHVFRNDMPQGNFVQLQLEGTGGSNRSAIGARVWVKAGGVTQMAEVGGGYGLFGQQNDLVLHFGLGSACAIDEVKVRWPDGSLTTQTWHNVRANYLVKLTQGAEKPGYPLVK